MRVGIVVPAYNVAPFLPAALGSLVAQTHRDWRAVVVDDGSTDDTAASARAIADPRIAVLTQPNAGVSAARNAGLARLPAHDAVLFLDADDWLAPDALARLGAALRGPAIAACGGFAFVDAAEHGGGRTVAKRGGLGGDILPRLMIGNRLANGGHLLIRTEAVRATGAFRTDLSFGEDWEYWTRLAARGRFRRVGGRPVLFVRTRADGAYRPAAGRVASFTRCLDAIYDNPAVIARMGSRLPRLRAQAAAEIEWIAGREKVRSGERAQGLGLLWRSLRARPLPRRLILLAGALAQPWLPKSLHGPFRAYAM